MESHSHPSLAREVDGQSSLPPMAKGSKPPSPEEVPPFSWSILFQLGRIYLKRVPGLAAVYLVCALLAQSVLPVSVTLLYRDISNHYSDAAVSVSPGQVTFISSLDVRWQYAIWVSLIIGVMGLTFLLRYVQSYFDGILAQAIRKDLFAAMMRQSPGFFLKNDANRLNMILGQYSQQAQMGLRQLLVDPVLQVISILVAGFALFGQITALPLNGTLWALVIGIGFFALLSPWITTLMSARLQNVAGAFQQQNLRLGTLVGNALQAPEEVQALQAEGFFNAKHAEALRESLRLKIDQTLTVERLNLLNRAPSEIVQVTLMALVVFFIGAQGSISPGTILALALLTPQFMGQVQGLSSYTINRSMTWPSLVVVNSILNQSPDVAEIPAARQIEMVEPTLEFRNVTFSYRPGQMPPVLKDVSYQLPPGKWTGLVGRSGQGKSTSFRLALRFYDHQKGEILLGGHPVQDYTLASLRDHVALMVQLPAFFYDTVRENLRVARPEATDEELRQVCELTGVWEKLVHLFGPDPLNAEFAGGMLLNPGNRKRFALARCLLRRPSYIFLDEPTAGLNPDNKFPLIPDLRKACAGKTVFLIEQDMLWLEQICDYILVLDGGSIVQRGTPAELSAQGGLYTELRDAHLRQGKEKRESVEPAEPIIRMASRA